MIIDVVRWVNTDRPGHCSRCGQPAKRSIPPYWKPTRAVCPTCCIELCNLYDSTGWPKQSHEK